MEPPSFIAIASGEFEDDRFEPLLIDDEVATLKNWLCSPALGTRQFAHHLSELSMGLSSRTQVLAALDGIAQRKELRPRTIFLYVTGHGVEQDGDLFIVLRDTVSGEALAASALRAVEIIDMLRTMDIELFMVIDLCHAGAISDRIRLMTHELPENWLILASAGRDQTAGVGALTSAIKNVLAGINAAHGGSWGDEPYLRIDAFLRAVREQLPHQEIVVHGQIARITPCLPNPRVTTEEPRRQLAIPDQFMAALSGSLTTMWFTGREALMQRLSAHLEEPPSVLVVAGAIGSGKSAALGLLVALCDARFTQTYPGLVRGLNLDSPPTVGSIHIAIPAKNGYSHVILRQILDAVGAVSVLQDDARTLLPEPAALARAWGTWLTGRDSSVTILIDGVDEAADPRGLVEQVLAPLVHPEPDQRKVRLIVGVRCSRPEGLPDQPRAGPSHDSRGSHSGMDGGGSGLVDRIMTALRAERVDVDVDPYWKADDLATYVLRVLRHSPGSPYAPAELERRAREMATELAKRSKKSFLVAQMAAERLVRTDPQEVAGQKWNAWLQSVDEGVVGVFREDVHAHTPAGLDVDDALSLLRAVAFARGAGMPWGRIWPRVAAAVAGRSGTDGYPDEHIRTLLDSRLAGYLHTSVEDQVTVYGFIHEALRDALLNRFQVLTGSDQTVEDRVQVEARIARHLSPLIVPAVLGSTPIPPEPYLRRHFAEHAISGDAVDDSTLVFPGLPYLDLNIARSRLREGSIRPHRLSALPALRRATFQWRYDDPESNAAALAMWTSALAIPLVEQSGYPWKVRSVDWPTGHGEILGELPCAISKVGSLDLDEGRAVAVATGEDGRLRTWDRTTGAQIGEPLRLPPGTVGGLSTAVLPDGVGVVLIGGPSGLVTWDLAGQRRVADIAGLGRPVAVVATVQSKGNGPAVGVACGGGSATARVWDLATGEPYGTGTLRGETDYVTAIAAVRLADDRLVAVTGTRSGLLCAWDLNTGEPIAHPVVGFAGRVTAVTAVLLEDHRTVGVAAAGGMIHTWILLTGQQLLPPLELGQGRITSLAVATLSSLRPGRRRRSSERDLLVLAACQARIEVRHLGANGARLIEPLIGHDQAITSMAVTQDQAGDLIAVTGSHDRTVRVWPVGRLVRQGPNRRPERRRGSLRSVAIMTEPKSGLALAAGDDGRIEILGPSGPLGPALEGHDLRINVVACVASPDGHSVVVSAGADKTVRAWDLGQGATPAGRILGRHPDEVAALAVSQTVEGLPIAVSGCGAGEVLRWNLHSGEPFGSGRIYHGGYVTAMAVGLGDDSRTIAVSGGRDGWVRRWFLDTAEQIGEPLHGTDGKVTAIAVVKLAGGRAAILGGGWNGLVRLWDLMTGHPIGAPLIEGAAEVTALTTTRLPNGTPVAVVGHADQTIQAWDLDGRRTVGCRLPTVGRVRGLAARTEANGIGVVIVGEGVAWAELRLRY